MCYNKPMQIFYYGGSSFKIISLKETILYNPLSVISRGAKGLRIQADIIIGSSPQLIPLKERKKGFFIDSPGEYEVKNIFIQGINWREGDKSKTLYQIRIEKIELGLLDEISKPLSEEFLKNFNRAEILFVPIGGKPYLETSEASKLVRQLKPKIVIPFHYLSQTKKILAEIEKFCQMLKVKKEANQEFLKIHKKDLNFEGLKVVVLKEKL